LRKEPQDVHDAVAAARAAQAQWASAGLEARANVLDAIGRELMARSKELGELLSREEGKTLPEGVGEVYRAGQFFTSFAGEALRNLGASADSVRAGRLMISVRARRWPASCWRASKQASSSRRV
jgi:aldehyde dehydrogenase (NAD+)